LRQRHEKVRSSDFFIILFERDPSERREKGKIDSRKDQIKKRQDLLS